MADFGSVFEALYNNFLLRDLFAKIVPGSAVLSAVLYRSPMGRELIAVSERIGWSALVVLAGLSWVVGYAVQNIGELLRVIRHHPANYDDGALRYKRRIAFSRVATAGERQQAERYAIIKEASGNNATAILLSLAILAARCVFSEEITVDGSFVLQAGLLVLIGVALIRANRSHARKQYRFLECVVGRDDEKG